MALYHFHVTQIKRSEGRTAVASAAYRAGEKLHNLWDGETHDYTKKGGVILSEIMLPEYAPKRLFDRSALCDNRRQKTEGDSKIRSYDLHERCGADRGGLALVSLHSVWEINHCAG